jgi:hypothetical protein
MVNAIGPIRRVVRGEDKIQRRYLVIAPGAVGNAPSLGCECPKDIGTFERHSECLVSDVGVNFGRCNAGMAQQPLNKTNINTAFN